MDREEVMSRYQAVRAASLAMCQPLEPEEYRMQVVEYASPVWWNLGHTSWLFAQVLREFGGQVSEEDAAYGYLLNSYYAGLGDKSPRNRRGSVTRPTTPEIMAYRDSVDRRIQTLVCETSDELWPSVCEHLLIGMHHEQQHQELFYTEIKLLRAQNPPEFRVPYEDLIESDTEAAPIEWIAFSGGISRFGNIEGGFGWDNEYPTHQRFLADFEMMNRLVTVGEYLEFMEDGGYRNELFWLSNGWTGCQQNGWNSPLYWEMKNEAWHCWTLSGMRSLRPQEPVCHLSFYEADAFTNWKRRQGREWRGTCLPSEFEWELACRQTPANPMANFLDTRSFHPMAIRSGEKGMQLLGDAWEWTVNHYEPYPGYEPYEGFLSEYNGKFMDNQRVLRGGSCVSERSHLRPSYRNFWPADTRFQFSGFRLVRR